MNAATHTAERVHQSDWLDHAARVGLVAYGVVHLLIAWLAIQLALGDKEDSASSSGAVHYLAEQPMGGVLVWLIAVGMFLLVAWMLLEFLFGHRGETDRTTRWRKRLTSLGKGVVYAVVGASAAKTAAGDSSGGGEGKTDSITSRLMDLPAGPFVVGAVGVAIIAVGGALVWKGWTEKFREDIDPQGQYGKDGSAYVLFGKVGYLVKGVAIALVGGLFGYAAITHDPEKSGGLDQALQTVLEYPFGQVLLVGIGAGIACFGFFCFAWARHISR
jgi:hypothetical protein